MAHTRVFRVTIFVRSLTLIGPLRHLSTGDTGQSLGKVLESLLAKSNTAANHFGAMEKRFGNRIRRSYYLGKALYFADIVE